MNLKFLVLASILIGAELPAAALAQTFTILSQNMLRFGHGKRLKTQCEAIEIAAPNVDVIVLQEVMKSGYPCLAENNNKGVDMKPPPDFEYSTSGPKGRTSYIEYYGILVRTNKRKNQQFVKIGENNALSNTADFARPPFGVHLEVTDTVTHKSCTVWIVDIHSIFGPTLKGRKEEAEKMKSVYNYLVALKNFKSSVIIAGDWNLPTTDAAFDWVRLNNAAIQPNEYTSLTATGLPSSAYDHIIYTSNKLKLPSVAITEELGKKWVNTNGLTGLIWRTTVSDHMGVIAFVALSC